MDASQQGTHFYFIGFQAQTPTGLMVSHQAGTLTPAPGAGRLDCLNQLQRDITTANPQLRNAVITAFCLEPNQL